MYESIINIMPKPIKIILGNASNSTYTLTFELLDIPIAHKWLNELAEFIDNNQPFDDRERFYNFPYSKFTTEYVVNYLNSLIDTINEYAPGLVEHRAFATMSQDTLNYLHHIFEVYHGLYDEQQSNTFFNNAPLNVKQALSDLNIWIHRYETLNGMPRFVGTWYGKPSRKVLAEEDFQHFSLVEHWGDLMINYCEVGKNLFDIFHDNDQYIDPIAFKPLHYYSVDFTVRFTNESDQYYNNLTDQVWEYYDTHQTFFQTHGYKKYDPKLALGWLSIGKIITIESKEVVLDQIGKHQYIKEIIIC